MANTPGWLTVNRLGERRKVLDTSEVIYLGDACADIASQFVLEVAVSGSGGSAIPKCRLRGSDLGTGALHDLVYYTVDSEAAITAGTAITAANIYYIPADGIDVYLDYTASTGSMTITLRPIVG